MKPKKDPRPVFTIIFIAMTLFFRLVLAFNRYFDVDEFSHLHWSYLILSGYIPYRDFFFYISPLFQFFLSPAFLLPQGPQIAVFARLIEFSFFLTGLYLLFRLAKIITGNLNISLMSVFILSIFPMTFDKTIDVRPDTLMMCFFLASLIIIARTRIPTGKYFLNALLAGLFFGAGMLLLPKLAFAVPLISVFLLKKALRRILYPLFFLIGAGLPFVLFLLYLLYFGILNEAIISILRDSFAVNSARGSFSLILSLSPWPLIYVTQGGISYPWVISSSLWILSIFGIIILTLKNRLWGICFIVLYLSGIIFLKLFPLPYIQYFLPFTYFASIAVSMIIFKAIKFLAFREFKYSAQILILVLLFSSFIIQYRERLTQDNTEQLTVLSAVTNISKPDERFFDMVGSYIFRPDGYPSCCHPVEEVVRAFPGRFPPLFETLAANETKFIVEDRTGQAFWKIPEEEGVLMKSNYFPSPYRKIFFPGVAFSCRQGACLRINHGGLEVSQNPTGNFNLFVSENYILKTSPEDSAVWLDGDRQINDGQSVSLEKGAHTFAVPIALESFSLIMHR